MTTPQQMTEFLEQFIADWPRQPVRPPYYTPLAPQYLPYQVPVASGTSSAQLAEYLLGSAEFRALKLGTWLQSPDGQLITAAVEAISPPPLREDIELLVTALSIAAKAQQGQSQERAILIGAASAVVGLALLATRAA